MLHSFKGQPAAYPVGELILDGAGDIFGTTSGAFGGAPVVLEITP